MNHTANSANVITELSAKAQLITACSIIAAHLGLLVWLALSPTGVASHHNEEPTLFVQWITQPNPTQQTKSTVTSHKTTPQKAVDQKQKATASSKSDTAKTEATKTTQSAANNAPVRALSISYSRPPQPVYPAQSEKLGEEGTVDILVTLDEKGLIQAAVVHRSSGFSRLDNAALEAARHARYQPYTNNGQAVRAQAIIPISFTLEESSP